MFKDLEFVKRMDDALKELGYADIRITLGLAQNLEGYYSYEVVAHWNDFKPYFNAGHLIIDAPFAEVERMIVDAYRRTANLLKGVEEDKVVM